MIRLPPADWAPNLNVTGGNIPPQSLWISEQVWIQVGRPESMEAFYEALRPKRTCCCGQVCFHAK